MLRSALTLLIAVALAVPALAKERAGDDPAVEAGRLAVTIHPWMIEWGILPDPLEGGSKAAQPK